MLSAVSDKKAILTTLLTLDSFIIMASENETGHVQGLLQSHLDLAEKLCMRCEDQVHVKGVSKLLKKCKAEQKFLQSLMKKNDVKESHLRSSNLAHLQGIMESIESLPGILKVLQPFSCPQLSFSLVVDVVCNHGYTWVKVIARKPQALHLIWAGEGQFGERNIVDQAEEYLTCAKHNQHNFRQPQIIFILVSGVTKPVKEALQSIGIQVQGPEVGVDRDVERKLEKLRELMTSSSTDEEDSDASDEDSRQGYSEGVIPSTSEMTGNAMSSVTSYVGEMQVQDAKCDIDSQAETLSSSAITRDIQGLQLHSQEDNGNEGGKSGAAIPAALSFTTPPTIHKVNLDITTLISLVSNVCHGKCHFTFQEAILTEQAMQERESPLLPKLHAFMKGKQLFACQTAVDDFATILGTVGGPEEKQRAENLLQQITVVPDQLSARSESLMTSAKVKDRARIIFGTGDAIQATTVSANVGFVRASGNQGVTFSVFLHEPRALTEQKEVTATPLPEEISNQTQAQVS